MISPAKQRAYEAWRRSVSPDVDRIVFDSAFAALKSRVTLTLPAKGASFHKLQELTGYPSTGLALAVVQELVDENVIVEINYRYFPAKGAKAADPFHAGRHCRRMWLNAAELAAVNKLLEEMRCPA